MSTPTFTNVGAIGGNAIGRMQRSMTVAVPDSLTNNRPPLVAGLCPGEVEFSWFASGRIFIPADSDITTLTFYEGDGSASNLNSNWGPSYMSDPTNVTNPPSMIAVTLTVAAGNWYPVPAAMFGCGNFCLVGNVAGTVYLSVKG